MPGFLSVYISHHNANTAPAIDQGYHESDLHRILLVRDERGIFESPHEGQGIETLISRALTDGPQRVIIGLDIPMKSEVVNLYGPSGPDLYAQLADEARTAFLRDMSEHLLGDTPFEVEHFLSLPYVALLLDEAGLQSIIDHPAVTSINTESAGVGLLNQSIPFIGADVAHSQGHSAAWQTVAVIDFGVDRNHPMFTGKVTAEACFSHAGYSSHGSLCHAGGYGSTGPGTGGPCNMEKTPCTQNPVLCETEHPQHCGSGHGSHVAGILAGSSTTPGGGIPTLRGTAYGAEIISIMPGSFLDDDVICYPQDFCFRIMESSFIASLMHVHSLRISRYIASVNTSILLDPSHQLFFATTCDWYWPAVRDAVNLLTAAGIQVYAASGNSGEWPAFQHKIGAPACFSNVMSVGATSKNSNQVPSYSNTAPILDVLAPGSLGSTSPGTTCRDNAIISDGIWSAYFHTGCSENYLRDAGTSMASPHAAGGHGLIWSRYPDASIHGIRAWLKASGVSVNFTHAGTAYTKPRINIAAAMSPPTAPSSGPANGNVIWMMCNGMNAASWSTVPGTITEYHVRGLTTGWTYYHGSDTSITFSVDQSESILVRACNMVACGPWSSIGIATYQPICH